MKQPKVLRTMEPEEIWDDSASTDTAELMELTQSLDDMKSSETLDNMKTTKMLDNMEPAEAIRFYVSKVLEAIEASTVSQKQDKKPPARPPHMLQTYLPPDTQQVLMFVITGGDHPSSASSVGHKNAGNDAQVRIVEHQGETSSSTVLIIDQWDRTEPSDDQISSRDKADKRKEKVIIDIRNQTCKLPMATDTMLSDPEDVFMDDSSKEGWSPSSVDVDGSDCDVVKDVSLTQPRRKARHVSVPQNFNESLPTHTQSCHPQVTCDVCKMQFMTKFAYNYHPCVRGGNESQFVCKLCGEKYDDYNEFLKHYRIHEEKKTTSIKMETPQEHQSTRSSVKCNVCRKQFALEHDFKSHPCLLQREEGYLVCKFCTEKYTDGNEFWKHYLDHARLNVKPHKCADCLHSFPTEELLKTHCVENNHVSHVQCTGCEEKFSSRNQLRIHKRLSHPQIAPVSRKWECAKCELTFASRDELRKHKNAAHPISCQKCSEMFSSKDELVAHRQSAHPITEGSSEKIDPVSGTWECVKCELTFASRDELLKHKSATHPFSCQKCPEMFSSKDELVTHRQSAHPMTQGSSEKMVRGTKCVDCFRIFTTPELLKEHCDASKHATHVQCTWCEEKFSSRNQLQTHKRRTHLSKPSCIKCKLVFSTKAELAAHRESVHPKTYTCHQCGKTFQSRAPLLLHRRDTHSQETYKCALCEKMFMKEASLKAHQAQHLGNLDSEVKHDSNALDVTQAKVKKEYVCEKCGRVTQTRAGLLQHLKGHEEKKITCELCGRLFHFKQSLERHMATHATERPFPCTKCGFRFASQRRLHAHQAVHGEKRYLCELCPMKFTDRVHLRRHQNAHANTNRHRVNSYTFHCLMCSEKFESPARRLQHYDDVHPLANFRCVECNHTVSSFDLLKTHFREQHMGKIIFCCRICGDAFGERQSLLAHRSKNHKVPVQTNSVYTKIVCDGCQKTFISQEHYVSHLTDEKCKEAAASSELETTPTKCTSCNEEFPTRSYMMTHIAVHGAPFPFSCKVCGESLGDISEVTDHITQHIAIGVWSCVKCRISVPTRQGLLMHMPNHSIMAAFQCTTCNKAFSSSSALVKHTYTHKGEESYRCQRCNASYKQANQLKAHLLAHDGRKMYECAECGKSFWLRSALVSHLRAHVTGEDLDQPPPTFDCNICGRVFTGRSHLTNHLRRHRGAKGTQKQNFVCTRGCKRGFTTRAHLIIHEQTHDRSDLVCPVCQRRFKMLKSLKLHMRIHTSESPMCPICGKHFSHAWNMEIHMASHNNEASDDFACQLSCENCNSRFRSRHCYVRHKEQCVLGFSGEVCRRCGLGFTTREKHDDHVKVCNVRQNRRTTENLPVSSLPTVQETSEQKFVVETISQEENGMLVADDATEIVIEEIHEAESSELVSDDGCQMLVQNVLQALSNEQGVSSSHEGAAQLERAFSEGQVPTELILDGPQGKVHVKLVYQTTT